MLGLPTILRSSFLPSVWSSNVTSLRFAGAKRRPHSWFVDGQTVENQDDDDEELNFSDSRGGSVPGAGEDPDGGDAAVKLADPYEVHTLPAIVIAAPTIAGTTNTLCQPQLQHELYCPSETGWPRQRSTPDRCFSMAVLSKRLEH